MRPIYHRDERRARGHIFVAVLEFLLERALEKKLKTAKIGLSAKAALEALRAVHVVELQMCSEHKRGVTGGCHRARQVLGALGISALEPPQNTETI